MCGLEWGSSRQNVLRNARERAGLRAVPIGAVTVAFHGGECRFVSRPGASEWRRGLV